MQNIQSTSLINSKHILLVLCLLFSSAAAWAQLYVQKSTSLSLRNSQTILSSQETLNQIDADIVGQGSFYLNSTTTQHLTSTKQLELPNLILANANTIHLETAILIQHQLVIETGILTLSQELMLNSQADLVLGEGAGIDATTTGLLIYKNTQLENSNPLAITLTTNFLKYRMPSIPQARPTVAYTRTSLFGNLVSKDHPAYLKNSTPPPKFIETIS